MLVGERRKAAVHGAVDRGDQGESVLRREPEPDSWIAAPVTAAADQARDAGGAGAGMSGAPGRLVVGDAADPEEARADRVADSVMRVLRREPGGAVTPDDAPIAALRRLAGAEASAVVGREGGTLDADLSGEIESHVGGGSPIPAALRRSMEGAFGRDLGSVRLHTDARAALLSRQVAARAFTVGHDVFFGAGEYRPDTPDGRHTLAHELAHTAAGGATARRVFGIGESKKTDQQKLDEERKKAAKR